MWDFDNLTKMEMSNALHGEFMLVVVSMARHYKSLSKAVPSSLSMQLFHICWDNFLEQLLESLIIFNSDCLWILSLDYLNPLRLCLYIKKLFLFLSDENLFLCTSQWWKISVFWFWLYFLLIGTLLCALKSSVNTTSLWHHVETSV